MIMLACWPATMLEFRCIIEIYWLQTRVSKTPPSLFKQNEFLQPSTTSASLVSPRFNTFAIACNLAVFRSFGSFSGALLSFNFPSSPDFKHHPCSFCFTLGIFLGEPRKSEGDCQQFSSDWQVPLRQEEAFMVTGLHLGGMMVEPRLKIISVASLGF